MLLYDGLMAPVLGTSKPGPEPFESEHTDAVDDMDMMGNYF